MKFRAFNIYRDVFNKPNLRYVKKFAFLPTKVKEGYWVWLESYYSEQFKVTKYKNGDFLSLKYKENERLLKPRKIELERHRSMSGYPNKYTTYWFTKRYEP